ncbi:hypothetical protein MNV49_007003 [Pseudohyphozyma bogoriensis]|nr:hypothetical protein MNV49_007003 [Pseudohyphozyma bogoriensis]
MYVQSVHDIPLPLLWPHLDAEQAVAPSDVKRFLLDVASTIPAPADPQQRAHHQGAPTADTTAHILGFLKTVIEEAAKRARLRTPELRGDATEEGKEGSVKMANLSSPPPRPCPAIDDDRRPSHPCAPPLDTARPRKASTCTPATTAAAGMDDEAFVITEHFAHVDGTWVCQHPACIKRNAQRAFPNSRKFGCYTAPRWSTSSINKRAKEHHLKHLQDERIEQALAMASSHDSTLPPLPSYSSKMRGALLKSDEDGDVDGGYWSPAPAPVPRGKSVGVKREREDSRVGERVGVKKSRSSVGAQVDEEMSEDDDDVFCLHPTTTSSPTAVHVFHDNVPPPPAPHHQPSRHREIPPPLTQHQLGLHEQRSSSISPRTRWWRQGEQVSPRAPSFSPPPPPTQRHRSVPLEDDRRESRGEEGKLFRRPSSTPPSSVVDEALRKLEQRERAEGGHTKFETSSIRRSLEPDEEEVQA